MLPAQPIEEDFRQFIEFGNIFDKAMRRYLVQYLKAQLNPTYIFEPHRYNDPQFDYLKQSLDTIFDNAQLRKITAGNEHLSNQIIHDTLQWMRKSQHEINKGNPCQNEFDRLQSWKNRPLQLYPDTWYHLTNFLKETYERVQLDVGFYEERLDVIFRDKAKFLQSLETVMDGKLPVERLMDDLLLQWEALLVEKSLQYDMQEMQQRQQRYAELLYAKVSEYEKMLDLITPFAEDVGRFWDLSRGLWKQTNFDVLSQYALLLDNEQSIRELADLLGRLREAQIEIEEELYEYAIAKAAYRPSDEYPTEIGGIHESNDLNRMLPSEMALLADSVTETVFYKKFAEHKLLSFQYRGNQPVPGEGVATDKRERTRKREKGPFILCVDASASMEGTPEYVAKVLCFAILKMAAQEGRKCYLISFSTGLQTINLLELQTSLDQVVKFLSMTFNGGTDIHAPMFEAIRMLQTHEYKDADVLMISDFIMYEMREELVKRMKAEQRRGTTFHSLIVADSEANPDIVALFDNYWTYDPASKAIARQLAEDLRKVG